MKVKKLWLISTTVVVVIYFVLWQIGLIGLWTHGIAFVANNTKDFTDSSGHIAQGKYSVSIDLSNLEGNLGKELYNDGIHRIYVSSINNPGRDVEGYQIGFRSSGQYSLSEASLISGVHHATVNGNSFTMNMTAKMTAEYNGKIYSSSEAGKDGLNYKDGDAFYFYIFPHEACGQELSLNEKGVVHLTVTDLYKNIWSKR